MRLKDTAGSGIDGVTKEAYAKDLDTNLTKLVERIHRMSYITTSGQAGLYPEGWRQETAADRDTHAGR